MVKIGDHETHPAADIFPMMEGESFAKLVADIGEHGLMQPIWRVWIDDPICVGQRVPRILDGRNRLRACFEACVKPEFRDYDGDDPIAFVVSLNLTRRHLDESQRAMVAGRIANLGVGRPGTAPVGAVVPQADAAKLLNVSRRGVQRARKVINNAAPEVVAAVERGEVSVSAAAVVAGLPVGQQREAVAKGAKGVKAAAAVEREMRKPKAPVEPSEAPVESEPDEWDATLAVIQVSNSVRAAWDAWPADASMSELELCLEQWVTKMRNRRKKVA